MELVTLPTWLVTTDTGLHAVLIDGATAAARLTTLASLEFQRDEREHASCVAISERQALDAAAEAIIKTRLARRARRGPSSLQEPTAELIGYPYWAYYFARGAGMLDAKLLDAVTGELTGPKLKTALFDALAQLSAAGDLARRE